MEPIRISVASDLEGEKRRAKLRQAVEQAKIVARDYLLSELAASAALLNAAAPAADRSTSARCRARARELYHAVEDRLCRIGLPHEQARAVLEHAAALRQRLDVLGDFS